MTKQPLNRVHDEHGPPLSAARNVIAMVVGVLLLMLSALMFAFVPGRLADEAAYGEASVCASGRRSDACLAPVPAAVKGKERDRSSRSVRYDLLVTEADSDSVRRVRMGGSGPVSESVRPGDEVTLTYWRGEIRSVRFGDAVEETKASPIDDWRLWMGIGLTALPVGLAFLWAGWWYRYRFQARPRGHYSWGPVMVLMAGLLLGCFGFFAVGIGGDVPGALVVMACGVPPSAAVSALFARVFRRRLRKAGDTSDIAPVRPAGKRVLHAGVRGDVPYSVSGFGYLVVGDGRPAATPDPVGDFARKDLPEALTVERVRGFLLGEDPEGWLEAYKYDGIVIECRDGDERVFIATRRRDAPLVLGALVTS